MLCRKAKNAEGKGVALNFFRQPLGDFRHPLKITLPSPGRNPETAPALGSKLSKKRMEATTPGYTGSYPGV